MASRPWAIASAIDGLAARREWLIQIRGRISAVAVNAERFTRDCNYIPPGSDKAEVYLDTEFSEPMAIAAALAKKCLAQIDTELTAINQGIAGLEGE